MVQHRDYPGRLFQRLGGEFDQLFGDLLDLPWESSWPPRRGFPAVNVWEDEDNYYAEAEIPGVPLENLTVEVVGNELKLQGERSPTAGAGDQVHRQEREAGKFERTVELPGEVDSSRVEAVLKNGVLTLTLAKSAGAKPHKINVKGSESA